MGFVSYLNGRLRFFDSLKQKIIKETNEDPPLDLFLQIWGFLADETSSI